MKNIFSMYMEQMDFFTKSMGMNPFATMNPMGEMFNQDIPTSPEFLKAQIKRIRDFEKFLEEESQKELCTRFWSDLSKAWLKAFEPVVKSQQNIYLHFMKMQRESIKSYGDMLQDLLEKSDYPSEEKPYGQEENPEQKQKPKED